MKAGTEDKAFREGLYCNKEKCTAHLVKINQKLEYQLQKCLSRKGLWDCWVETRTTPKNERVKSTGTPPMT